MIHVAAKAVLGHFSVMVTRDIAQLFVAGPPVVKHAMGYDVTKEDLGGWHIHCRNGAVDYLAESEDEAMAMTRRFLSYLPSSVYAAPPVRASSPDDPPDRREDAFFTLIPRKRTSTFDVRQAIRLMADRDSFFEIGSLWGTDQVVGLVRFNGHPVGVIASDSRHPNGGALTADGCDKLTRHLDLCDLVGFNPCTPFILKADGVVANHTWCPYGEDLESNLQDLSERLQRGAYRAKPVRRAYIPKLDGRQRPIGGQTLEAKIIQRAVVEVLNAIYEADFLGFSYGSRPRRNPHQALDALTTGVMTRRVNWVLDADIRAFYDTLVHGWLVRFVEHRVADRRVVRLIQKWLKAGVLEEGRRTPTEVGTVQGGSISPLLANVYLHYVFDLWVQRWRQKQARADVVVVRFADDFVVGFEHRQEAERFLEELRERLPPITP